MRGACETCEHAGDGWWWCGNNPATWSHRPWWKVTINTILRLFQRRGPGAKWVIATKAELRAGTYPLTTGYTFRKVYHT